MNVAELEGMEAVGRSPPGRRLSRSLPQAERQASAALFASWSAKMPPTEAEPPSATPEEADSEKDKTPSVLTK